MQFLNFLGSFFLLGISLGAGPCMVTCGPFLISYVVGTGKDHLKGLSVYLLFSFSRIISYCFLSLLIYFVGKVVMEYHLGRFSRYLFFAGGSFMILIGFLLVLQKFTNDKFCLKLKQLWLHKDKKTVILLGLLIGLLPCSPLAAIFAYIALVSKNPWTNLSYSLSFGLGTVISPLILLVPAAAFLSRLIKNTERFWRWLNIICGFIIMLLGIQLILKGV